MDSQWFQCLQWLTVFTAEATECIEAVYLHSVCSVPPWLILSGIPCMTEGLLNRCRAE